jgi:hypothetical protein
MDEKVSASALSNPETQNVEDFSSPGNRAGQGGPDD